MTNSAVLTADADAAIDDSPQPKRSQAMTHLLLAGILLLAAGLRLHHLANDSLWFDEALTAALVQAPWREMLPAIAISEQTPPLHHSVVKIWTGLIGTVNEWTVRVPS